MAGFQFKHFSLENNRAAMKVGTDGVLLGAWTQYLPSDAAILDVGTGTGVLSLIAAQRYSYLDSSCGAKITAIDIDSEAVTEATANFSNSPWPDILTAQKISLQALTIDVANHCIFDLILSNPPYFENCLRSPDSRRAAARNTDTLSYGELVGCSAELLRDGGRLSIILPYEVIGHIRALAVTSCFKITRVTSVRTTPAKLPKRVLMELTKSTRPLETKNSELIIQSAGEYTKDYIDLVSDLYPKF